LLRRVKIFTVRREVNQMKEAEFYYTIIKLNENDEQADVCEDVFQTIIEETDFDIIDRDEMLQQYKCLIQELKYLHSEVVGLYLEKIIEARAT